MAGFRVYEPARKELEDIWFYTYGAWGEAQANKYIHALQDCFRKLAEKKIPWRAAPRHIAPALSKKRALYYARYERHYIFFRALKNKDIGILSVLHDAVDIPVKLREDLAKIEERDAL